jgi:outer membrane receptor protein involved in Fe transport
VRNTSQVVSVLSSEEIARTGEGEISGALQRVTGLSVTNNGFVFVRGLGDRYSLALLNGLALPSPEPLRRVVPLDIFPTSIVSSAVVQKSYSVNYPGEYGGGVINLTTASLPEENFLTVGGGVSGDSETTQQLGYMYHGSSYDWFGYDDGLRELPAAVRDNGGQVVGLGLIENEDTLTLQRSYDVPFNWGVSTSAGYGTDLGDSRFGVLASLSYSNDWRTRGATQEVAASNTLLTHSYGVRTENRLQANGLLTMGLDLPQGHTLRWTSVYIHDTSKVARVRGVFSNIQVVLDDLTPELLEGPYNSLSYESSYVQRQLWTSQLVGEFEWDLLELDLRGSYSNTKRDSPYDRATRYNYIDSTQAYAIALASPSGINFSYLNEDVWAGGADLSYELTGDFLAKFSAGYAYSDTSRRFRNFDFSFVDGGSFIQAGPYAYLLPYQVFSPTVIAAEDLGLIQTNNSFGLSEYLGDLTVHGAYGRVDMELAQGLRVDVGVRYETAKQTLTLPDVNNNNPAGAGLSAVVEKDNDYWLPALTLTWNFAEDFQFRANGSKTIARPQFRELGTIPVVDTESDRLLAGNPFLTDSQLYNAEARIEFYPAREERISVAGFYKRIDKPIEAIANIDPTGTLRVGNANAPKADLYGAEAEVVKYFYLTDMGAEDGFFANKRLLLSANYTYSKSKIRVADDDTTIIYAGVITNPITIAADDVFIDGTPLTGQSEHLANLQFGIEDTEKLQQLTFMLTYASERVTSRGSNSSGVIDPDIIENPGLNFDIVARVGFEFEGVPLELKLQGRNLLGRPHYEYQNFPNYRVPINDYDIGRSFSASLSATF